MLRRDLVVWHYALSIHHTRRWMDSCLSEWTLLSQARNLVELSAFTWMSSGVIPDITRWRRECVTPISIWSIRPQSDFVDCQIHSAGLEATRLHQISMCGRWHVKSWGLVLSGLTRLFLRKMTMMWNIYRIRSPAILFFVLKLLSHVKPLNVFLTTSLGFSRM